MAEMWVLLTDRNLKGWQIYGPLASGREATALARELFRRGRIKSWSVAALRTPPRIEGGQLIDNRLYRTGDR